MNTIARVALPALILLAPVSVAATETQMHRCTDPQGNITFQIYHCEYQDETFIVRTVTHGWTKLRAGEKLLLNGYRAEEQQRRSRRAAATRLAAAKTASGSESKPCFSKRKGLERVRAKLRRGYKPGESMRLRSQRNEYEEYIKAYCR